ncbi:MAG: Methyltransferase type 12 [Nonomuraea muscovyensis]|uniref:Trans-aconitate methyltransferase n=1 Tax=Nonomuraea muscovyensis TaxID=1124761 RepID=A0A7X0F230_9ACTN|nr:class I SAM-dependent methyltransferase [Nonomuraea muscovyensis]MBB6350464.1 trans-aconitate methyltransferase [Nonomuraea muscovyensis]MDF2706236.1 Methyltransferase type 12 [Nonomuraea muscovyensis]
MKSVEPQLAREWLQRWDAQQERYVAARESRFATIGHVLAAALRDVADPLILDLGCGPGSLSARMAGRLPAAEIVGVDVDPLLLALARGGYPDAARFVEADLGVPGWSTLLGLSRKADAAMSTTALHYLPPDVLAEVYLELAGQLRPGGIFVNADNLYDEQPTIAHLAAAVRQSSAAVHNEDWSSWWRAVEEEPALADLLAEREARPGHGGGDHHVPASVHADLLRSAGFSEVGTVWQVGDDMILVAVR